MNIRRLTIAFSAAVFSAVFLAGCAGSGSAVVAKIADEPLTLAQFEESYAKNNGGWEKAATSTMEDRERFLDLLVKFRLKVKEAMDQGLLADSSLRAELDSYKVTVATSYMIEKEIVEPAVKQIYNRKLEEIRASHILIRVNLDAPPADTLAAYNKAMKAISMIPKYGFDTLAVSFSEDQSASFNKGDVGFFSAGRMVPEFEDACYGLKVGEYTHVPIRTQFGYHVIKVTARQPYKGAVHLKHILLKFSENRADTTAVKDSIWMVYRLIKGGMNFGDAVKKYTQDAASRETGGDIGFYERERIPPDIQDVFYTTPVDSITQPMRMPYGWHIFQVAGFKEMPSYAELEKDLRQQYEQTRYNADHENYVRKLKTLYKTTPNNESIAELSVAFDSTQTPALMTWSDTLSAGMRSKVLFTCQNHPSTVDDFIQYINTSAEFKTTPLTPKNIRQMVDHMSDAKIVEEHAKSVPQRYPEFSRLLKEYQDGILLYRIEQDEVWKKIVVNDSLLKIYYDANKEKYRWPDRVNFAEIYVTTDSLAQAAYKEIRAGKDFGAVAAKYTMRQGYKDKKGIWGLTAISFNDLSRNASELPVDSVTAPFTFTGGWSIIKVLEKDSARVKTFDEASAELMSSYQEEASKVREQQWVASLKEHYPVVLNKELLQEAFKGKPVVTQ